ncbi:unnamed protein product [Paramecium octaurelia]|uniref:Uncharacterized protein n=1 Tax=Paramecium octaurelia TaxID=43137 RepID=A0A8S1YLV7_PAROT|nr:unnamed protein product [Paramecium octaurelia]
MKKNPDQTSVQRNSQECKSGSIGRFSIFLLSNKSKKRLQRVIDFCLDFLIQSIREANIIYYQSRKFKLLAIQRTEELPLIASLGLKLNNRILYIQQLQCSHKKEYVNKCQGSHYNCDITLKQIWNSIYKN